ncbi:MAG TPA: aspartate/glutamate racemase family protein, partial [Chloroflexota bacterium]
MYGWRGRIGMLVPSVNTVCEYDFYRMAPPGITCHAARIRNSRGDRSDTLAMLQHVERAADELASAHVDVVTFVCTSGSFVEGRSGEAELCARIRRVAGVPVVTTSGAVAEALSALGVRRLVMATPYIAELNEAEVRFLQEHGFEVLREKGMGIVDAYSIAIPTPQDVYRFVREEVWDPQADAVFISCTNLCALDAIGPLESDLGVPVVTSNQATFWGALRALGCGDPVKGFGRLLELPRVTPQRADALVR